MRRAWFFIPLFMSIGFFLGCVEPYQPNLAATDLNLLVVDGFVNATDASAEIVLSRAVQVGEAGILPEGNATVRLESGEGSVIDLLEKQPGRYSQEHLVTTREGKWRLYIKTQSGAEYRSAYVTRQPAGEIDSITWTADAAGVRLFLFSKGAPGSSRYYRWKYDETWEYISSFVSSYMLEGGTAVQRLPDDRIYMCWSTVRSPDILSGTTAHLSSDIVFREPIGFIPATSAKLGRRYSVLVSQTSVSKDHYDFLQGLKKTTEQLGGLFDPQPSRVVGNVTGVTGTDPVLGYFSIGEVVQKRIFIRYYDLPDAILAIRRYPLCDNEDLRFIPLAQIPREPASTLLVDPVSHPISGQLLGFTSGSAICVDCRAQGGTTRKPDYW